VDRGSRLLLKVLAQRLDLEALESAWDLGCGVGVLGLCLKKKNPRLRLKLTDRDALALAFARSNSELNGTGPVGGEGALGLGSSAGEAFSLIVSNLPAKAGAPVLGSLFRSFSRHLAPAGMFACVIIAPLSGLAESCLLEAGAEIRHREASREHVALVARGSERETPPQQGLEPYLRGRFPFQAGGHSYSLRTAYNLPDFDTLGYGTQLAMEMMRGLALRGSVGFWNPGQGHLPLFCALESAGVGLDFVLGSRDLLQLRVAAHNLLASGLAPRAISLRHAALFRQLEDPCSALVVVPDADPGVPWQGTLLEECAARLPRGGFLVLAARSADAYRLLAGNIRFTVRGDRKLKGFRGLLLRKK